MPQAATAVAGSRRLSILLRGLGKFDDSARPIFMEVASYERRSPPLLLAASEARILESSQPWRFQAAAHAAPTNDSPHQHHPSTAHAITRGEVCSKLRSSHLPPPSPDLPAGMFSLREPWGAVIGWSPQACSGGALIVRTFDRILNGLWNGGDHVGLRQCAIAQRSRVSGAWRRSDRMAKGAAVRICRSLDGRPCSAQ